MTGRLVSITLLGLFLCSAAFRKHHVDPKVKLEQLKKAEYHLVDKLFSIAQNTIMMELDRSRAEQEGAAQIAAHKAASSAAKAQANAAATNTKAFAAGPAGAPGAPGAKLPFGKPKKAYLGINPAMKAKTEPIFTLKCAEVLDQMVNKRVNALAKWGMSNETIGVDMATHFQVQCPGSIPMPEDKCDDHATKLAKLIDSGKPVFIPPPPGPSPGPSPAPAPAAALVQMRQQMLRKLSGAAPAAALIAAPGGAPGAPGGPGGKIESGNDWCKQFFGEFFDAIVAQVAAAGPAGAPGGAPAR